MYGDKKEPWHRRTRSRDISFRKPNSRETIYCFEEKTVLVENGLKFCIRTAEKGHCCPHVHVDAGEIRVSIDINTLEVRGKLSSKCKREVRRIIIENRDYCKNMRVLRTPI